MIVDNKNNVTGVDWIINVILNTQNSRPKPPSLHFKSIKFFLKPISVQGMCITEVQDSGDKESYS